MRRYRCKSAGLPAKVYTASTRGKARLKYAAEFGVAYLATWGSPA